MTNAIATETVVPTFVYGTSENNVPVTKEGLMLYLQTRLEGLDGQIQGMFDKQKKIERIRQDISTIQTELQKMKNDQSLTDTQGTADAHTQNVNLTDWEKNMMDALEDIKQVDPVLGEQMMTKMRGEGQALNVLDGQYSTAEVRASTEYLNGLNKQLESSAQLEMINLQSLMSARQTSIQLSTNLVSALNESNKAIAANVGK